jgi:hypothetical protein
MDDIIKTDGTTGTDQVAERKKPGPKPRGALPIVWPIKGTRRWLEWLRRFAESQGKTPTAYLDDVLRRDAKRLKFEAPPSRIGDP